MAKKWGDQTPKARPESQRPKIQRRGCPNRAVWVVQHKGPVGDINNSLGIAECLTPTPKLIFVEDIAAAGGVDAYVKQLQQGKNPSDVLPDVIITTRAENSTVDSILALKKLSGNRICIVSFRDRNPQSPRKEFDLTFMPEHEAQSRGGNVVICNGMPHRATPALLKTGQEVWQEQLSHYVGTKIAVMVGGNSLVIPSEQGGGEFTVAEAAELGKKLNAIAKQHNACLLITNSHRTPEASWNALCEQIIDVPAYLHHYKLDAAKGNPYFGLLAMADVLIPTADSMSMCAECCSTGKPVFIAGMEFGNVRSDHRRFIEQLIKSGHVRPLEKHYEAWTSRPAVLDTAGDIAKEITNHLQKHRTSIMTRLRGLISR